MNFTTPWDTAFEQSPQGTESVSAGDDRIRELKLAIRERVQDGWWEELKTPVYLSTSSFYLAGDMTARYVKDRPLAINQDSTTVFTTVAGSSYDSGADRTTITVTDEILTSTMNKVYFAAYAFSLIKIPEPPEQIVPLGGKTGGDLAVTTAGSIIQIKPGYREVGGKWYHWDTELSFTIGPSGSNPDSDSVPTTAQLVYLYIDASSLPSNPDTALTDANFISKSTAPSWDDAKHGWYDGDDRLIGTLKHDGTNLILQQKNGNRHWYGYKQTEITTTYLDQVITFTSVPGSGIAVGVACHIYNYAADSNGYAVDAEFYPTDGTNKIGGVKSYWYGYSIARLMVAPSYIPFMYPHNKLWVRLANSAVSALVDTDGFVYHDAI